MALSKLVASASASITDFKTNPNRIMDMADGEPVAVLKSNAPYFYAVPAETFEAMSEAVEDLALLYQANARLQDGQALVDVDLDDL